MNDIGSKPLTWRENVTDADEASQLIAALRDRTLLSRRGVLCMVNECSRELVAATFRVTFGFMQVTPVVAA